MQATWGVLTMGCGHMQAWDGYPARVRVHWVAFRHGAWGSSQAGGMEPPWVVQATLLLLPLGTPYEGGSTCMHHAHGGQPHGGRAQGVRACTCGAHAPAHLRGPGIDLLEASPLDGHVQLLVLGVDAGGGGVEEPGDDGDGDDDGRKWRDGSGVPTGRWRGVHEHIP